MNETNLNLARALHNLFEKTAKKTNRKIGANAVERLDPLAAKDGGYKCIHLNPMDFFTVMNSVIKVEKINPRQMTFLDVGCGLGEKVFFAGTLGFNSFGLELRRPLITAGKKMFQSLDVSLKAYTTDYSKSDLPEIVRERFIQGNALTFDYSRFDIIYFYCPLRDEDLQRKLEDRIAQTAKPGTIVIPFLPKGCFCHYEDRCPPKGWERRMAEISWNRYFVKRRIHLLTGPKTVI